jgi:hypothetical protein
VSLLLPLPRYRQSIETITTVLMIGNIRGRYTELPGFAKLVLICVSGLSQIAVIFRSFEAAAEAAGTVIPVRLVDDLPTQIESCLRLLGVVSWILEDHASDAVRERWRSHLVQCGLVTHAMNILMSCDSVLLLDRATRCLASAFEIHPAHEVVLQSSLFLHNIADKVTRLYVGACLALFGGLAAHTRTHTHIRARTHIHTHTHTHTWAHTHTHTYTHTRAHSHTHTHTHTHKHTQNTHTCIHTHTFTHTNIHKHTMRTSGTAENLGSRTAGACHMCCCVCCTTPTFSMRS